MSRDTTSTEESDDGRFNRIRSRPAVGLAVVLAVVAGLVVAPSVYGAVTGPDGTVAVVEIDGSIDSATAQHVEDNLREARTTTQSKRLSSRWTAGADSRHRANECTQPSTGPRQ